VLVLLVLVLLVLMLELVVVAAEVILLIVRVEVKLVDALAKALQRVPRALHVDKLHSIISRRGVGIVGAGARSATTVGGRRARHTA